MQELAAQTRLGLPVTVMSDPRHGRARNVDVAQSGGGYKLYTIAHIYIENYLYGVLPYEMGNSAHLEALRAQAVAARTYTVRMMSSRAGRIYDVYDNTNGKFLKTSSESGR